MSYCSFVTQDCHTELMQNKFAAVINQKLIWPRLVWVKSTISTKNTPSFVKSKRWPKIPQILIMK